MARAVPFHFTVDPLMKLAPFTVSVNAGFPAVAIFGARDMTEGTGLLPAAEIVKGKLFEVPPPGAGVTTVTPAVPAKATRVALTEAVNCSGPENVVGMAVPFQ